MLSSALELYNLTQTRYAPFIETSVSLRRSLFPRLRPHIIRPASCLHNLCTILSLAPLVPDWCLTASRPTIFRANFIPNRLYTNPLGVC